MSGYNNPGVPYYAHPSTPSPRPRELPPTSQEWLEGKARQMQARTLVRAFVRKHWKAGDRFFVSDATRRNYLGGEDKSIHAGRTGIFKELKLVGNVWLVLVEWLDYRPKTRPSMGMFDFYHFAFSLDPKAEF